MIFTSFCTLSRRFFSVKSPSCSLFMISSLTSASCSKITSFSAWIRSATNRASRQMSSLAFTSPSCCFLSDLKRNVRFYHHLSNNCAGFLLRVRFPPTVQIAEIFSKETIICHFSSCALDSMFVSYKDET